MISLLLWHKQVINDTKNIVNNTKNTSALAISHMVPIISQSVHPYKSIKPAVDQQLPWLQGKLTYSVKGVWWGYNGFRSPSQTAVWKQWRHSKYSVHSYSYWFFFLVAKISLAAAPVCSGSGCISSYTGTPTASQNWGCADRHLLYLIHRLRVSASYRSTLKHFHYLFKPRLYRRLWINWDRDAL